MDNTIRWAGRTLHGTDRFGRWVTLRGQFEGWWDSPETKGETADRENADGEYDLPTHNQARLVPIGGYLYAAGRRELREARNFLTGPMFGRLQVTDSGATQWAEAKRLGGVKFTTLTDTLAQWQIRLKCVDPRKFGDMNTTVITPGVDQLVFHRGNYEASPIITVTGNLPGGYTLWGPDGRTYVVTAALAPGTTHTIDMNHGLLRTNQYYFTGGVGDADVWTIPPGQTVNMGFTVQSGTGTATVTVPDTYI